MWTCKACENSNPDTLMHCEVCGAEKPKLAYVPKSSVAPTPRPNVVPPSFEEKKVAPPKHLKKVKSGSTINLAKHPHVWVIDGELWVDTTPTKTKTKTKK